MHKERYDYLKKYVEADDGKVTIINNAGKTSHEAFGFDLIDSQIIEGLNLLPNKEIQHLKICLLPFLHMMMLWRHSL